MQTRVLVHSAVTEKVAVTARLGNQDVQADVDGLTVELVGPTGTHTHRFVPDGTTDIAALRELFVPGAAVAITFSKGDAA